MKLPIIVNDNPEKNKAGDVSFYTSVEAALLDFEPLDVEGGGFIAFDAEGRLLRLRTDGERIFIEKGESNPTHGIILEKILREFFQKVGLDPKLYSTASLPELVRMGAETFGE